MAISVEWTGGSEASARVAPAVVPQVEKGSKRTLLGEDAGEVALGRLMGRLCLLGLVIGGFINPLLFPVALAFYPLYFLQS